MMRLFKKTFDSVEELDAFVEAFKLARGIEFQWNRLERAAWLWCDSCLHRELQACLPEMRDDACEDQHA